MTSTSRRRVAVVAAAIALVAVTVGTGFAYWMSAGGGGTGSAATGGSETGAMEPVIFTPAVPTEQLYPGRHTAVGLTATNPNPSDVRIGSLILDTSQGAGGFGVDGGHPGCTLTTLSFTTQTNGGAGWVIPAGGTLPVTLADSVSMSIDAASACEGAIFTIYLTATADEAAP